MKLFRKIASHYISMAVSFHYLLGHPAAGKEDMAITKTGVILLIVHLMNVATVLLLVLSPSQMDTLASLFAGTSRRPRLWARAASAPLDFCAKCRGPSRARRCAPWCRHPA